MKRFVDADSMWTDAVNAVITNGTRLTSRDGDCSEVFGWVGELDPTHNIVTCPVRKLSVAYAAAEMIWYLSGERSVDMIARYAPQYVRFATGRDAFGAYGYRLASSGSFEQEHAKCEDVLFNEKPFDQHKFWPKEAAEKLRDKHVGTQLGALITLLREKPQTRQAVLTMWESGDLLHAIHGHHGDIPCTLSLQFLLRNGKLDLMATMRSNDVWLGLPYDVFCFTTLQRLIAWAVGAKLGRYIHSVGSLHIYDRNRAKCEEHMSWWHKQRNPGCALCHDYELPSGAKVSQLTNQLVLAERKMRLAQANSHEMLESEIPLVGSDLHDDLLKACWSKLYGKIPETMKSHLFRRVLDASNRGTGQGG